MHRNHNVHGAGLVALVLAAAAAWLFMFTLPDIRRYLRIHRM